MNNTGIHRLRFVLSALCLLLCIAPLSNVLSMQLLSQLELIAYDWRMTTLPLPTNIDNRIVIVDIDERSLAIEGQWPWPRSRIAELVTRLSDDYAASAVGLDILFPEQSRHSEDDAALTLAISRQEAIMAQLFQLEQGSRALNVGLLGKGNHTLSHLSLLPAAEGYIGNSASVLQNNRTGHISIDVDIDGKARRLPPLISFANASYESLPLAMLCQLFSITSIEVSTGTDLLSPTAYLQAAAFQIPLNSDGRMLIPYQASAGQFLYIPATDVLQKKVNPALLQNSLVLIGSSATGLFDLISTPWSKSYPGVEVHANILSALLDNRLVSEPANSTTILIMLCAALFVLVMLCYQRMSVLYVSILSVVLGLGWLLCNWIAWHHYQLALPVITPLLLLLLLVLINTPALALLATHQRQQLFKHFQDYVPRGVVEQLARLGSHHGIKPQRRDMTVMFMDIRGFTSIAETLTPTQLSELMTQVLSPVTRIIHEHGGTIDKYMGDAVMAFWGAPLAQANHAERAVSTAQAIRQALKPLNQQLQLKGFPAIRVGIGINSGNMTVGNMGSDFRVSYTVIGDAVNIASRLEGLTKHYTTDILMGGATAKQLPENSGCLHLGKSMIKGRRNPVELYILPDRPEATIAEQDSVQ